MSKPDPCPHTGETLAGRYRLNRGIGDGGYGVVYEAHDLHSGTAVAAKLLKPLDAEKLTAAEQAMRREATVRVSHPNIASPIDGGEHGGRPYVVSRLAAGQSIQSALEAGWVPSGPEITHLLSQGLDAAQACHDAGVIHRDLSARNTLIDRATGHLTVIDFGSVYLQHDPSQQQEVHYHATPGLIPPEMLASQSRVPGPAQDQFAIGVLGYQLVTGDTPFPGSTPDEVNRSVSSGTRIPIQQIVPHADPHLVGVVDRLMAHRPEDRFRSAGEACQALRYAGPHSAPHAPPHAASPPPTSTGAAVARCSHCGHRSPQPACQTCGSVFVPGVVINLWECVTAVHSSYFIAEGEHAFGRAQVDPRDRTLSRKQLVITAGQNLIRLSDGGSVNPTSIQGVSPGGMAKPGTTLFIFGRYTGHLVSA